MLILAVDTSTRVGSLALLRDQTVLGQEGISPDLPYSGTFSPCVDHLLNALGMHLGDIDVFAVAAGPGSFTGLRIGLTAVKAWAETFGKPVAAVSGLEAIAAQVSLSADSVAATLLAPVLDARRGQVFGGFYRRIGDGFGDLRLAGPEVVTSADEFVELVRQQLANGEIVLFPSPTPEAIRPALDRSALASSDVQQVSGVLAPIIGRLGHVKALRGDLVDGLRLDANYVRRTDAELRWKDRQN
jgi:tRNA threonylcarbamoyladenosine biosynthesis protein TsaB